jgi:hypothetical protein
MHLAAGKIDFPRAQAVSGLSILASHPFAFRASHLEAISDGFAEELWVLGQRFFRTFQNSLKE